MEKTIKFSLVIFLLGFHCISGEKLNRLENLIANLSNKFGDFVSLVDKITHMLKKMDENDSLNDLIEKCLEHINARNEVGLNKIWQQILKSYSETTNILNKIIIDSYSGKRENILTLIRFIAKTNKCSGFETLFYEMHDYGHFFDGGEIFSLANSIHLNCNQTLFEKLPHAVQIVFTKNCSLENTLNRGFLFRKMNVRDHGLENHVATRISNTTDFWRFTPAGEYAETFIIQNRNSNLVVSPSRRMYFSNSATSKFFLQMNRKEEISIGLEIENTGGRKFYRLYVQNKKNFKVGDTFELNLWTINPKDEYFRFIYWKVAEQA